MTIHAANAAMIKKLLLTVKIKSAEIPSTIYLPATGIRAIQIAAIRILVYRRSGFGDLSALLPP